jgi:murein DD-endopeptidase MepM/ murein hydrolase activator NlpD
MYPNSKIGHMGVDLSAVVGTPILAAADGVVQWVDSDAGWGNYIRVLYPGYGFHGFYAHMRETSSLKSGQSVKAGQTLGYTGNTGNSTGPHLHYSVRLADPDKTDAAAMDDTTPTDPYLGTSANPFGYVDPILFHNMINQWGSVWQQPDDEVIRLRAEVAELLRQLGQAEARWDAVAIAVDAFAAQIEAMGG